MALKATCPSCSMLMFFLNQLLATNLYIFLKFFFLHSWKLYLLSILWNKDMSGPSITYFHIVSSLFSPYCFSTFCEEDAITTLSYKTFFSFWVAFQILFPNTSLEHPFFLSMPTSLIIYHFGVSLSSTNVSNETWPHILQIQNSITFLCIP
jgi:hypothetical protein